MIRLSIIARAISVATLAGWMPTARASDLLAPLPTVNRSVSLSGALSIAAMNNLSVKQAEADFVITQTNVRAANAQSQPSAATTSYGLAGDSNNIVGSSPGVSPENYLSTPSRGVFDQNLIVMTPLYTGGKVSSVIGAAKNDSSAAHLMTDEAKLQTQLLVTDSYVNALLNDELVQVAQSRLTSEDEQVRITKERVDAGRSAPVDLLRDQAEEANAQQDVLAAHTAEAESLIRLKTVLGISQDSQISLADTLATVSVQPALPGSSEAAMADAHANRPDLAAAMQKIASARDAVHGASAAYAPQVYAIGMADASAQGSSQGRAGYTVGLSASLPLYDGGQRRADIDGAKARLARTVLDAQAVRQSVDEDVASAWLIYQSAAHQAKAAALGVAAAQQAYGLSTMRYNAGKSIDAERLDALTALTRAQGDQSTATAAVVDAEAALVIAVGLPLR